MNSTYLVIVTTVVVGIAALAVWGFGGVRAPLPVSGDPFNKPNTVTKKPGDSTMGIYIALLDTAGITDGKERGCDRVVMVQRDIAATTGVLAAAMRELFKEEREQVEGAFNFIARTNNTLRFERATVEDGTAKIYLTGSLSGLAGVCDDPRAAIQIEETAMQFNTVEKVEIYLNGEKTNLTPSQQ